MRKAADDLLAATEARRVELGKRWKQVYLEAGLTHQTLNRWRHGHPVDPLTERALERVLQWAPGAREAIAAGRKPRGLSDAEAVTSGSPTQAAQTPEPSPSLPPPISPAEALRRMVRSSARELGVTAEGLDEVFRAVRQDLGEAEGPALSVHGMPVPTSGRTDLSDMVRERRAELGMSLEEAAARAVDPGSGEHVVDVGWLERLERGELDPSEFPEYPQLDALTDALHLDPGLVQGAAGIQFMEVHHTWSKDGQVRGIGFGELQGEDLRKAQALTQMYRKAPRKDG